MTFGLVIGRLSIVDKQGNLISNIFMSETYKPKSLKRKRKHGFLKRNSTKKGKNVLKARRQKGRKSLAVA